MSDPNTAPNENVLAGMCCPGCGSQGPFRIVAEAVFLVFDDGTDDYSDVQWDPGSRCSCEGCGFSGSVQDFTIPDAEEGTGHVS